MSPRVVSSKPVTLSLLYLAFTTGCVDSGASKTSEGIGGSDANGGGASSTLAGGDATGLAGGGNNATGGSRSTEAQTSTVAAPIDPPPAAPTNDVPEPNRAVTAPNLRVLPWAGFTAAVSYTFDDTQPSQVEHWPDLKATNVPLTFFANPSSNWRAGYDTTWSDVAASGCEIGNHTWSHCQPSLSDCTPVGTAEEEIDKASEYIKTNLGMPDVYSFAAPFGATGWNKYAAPRFLVGRGVMSGMVPATGVSDWYNLPVFGVTEGQTEVQFNASIDQARAQGRWDIFMFHSIRPTSNDWYAGVEMSGISASLEYAKAFGDVWLDTFVEVGAYVRAQQMFEAVTPSDNTWSWKLPEHFPPGKVLRVVIDGGKLSQNGKVLPWDAHGYYEVSLDVGALSWSP